MSAFRAPENVSLSLKYFSIILNIHGKQSLKKKKKIKTVGLIRFDFLTEPRPLQSSEESREKTEISKTVTTLAESSVFM